MPGRVIVVEETGQLGNQLILFAHLIALAEEYGFHVLNPPFRPYRAAFVGSRAGFLTRYPAASSRVCATLDSLSLGPAVFRSINLLARTARRSVPATGPLIGHMTCGGHSPDFDIDLSTPENVAAIERAAAFFLFGWRYRNYPLFKKHEAVIRRYFAFAKPSRAEAYVAGLRANADIVIGAHVRHGDYADFEGGRYFLAISDYAAAVRALASQLQPRSVAVAVFSNVPQDPGAFAGLRTAAGPGEVMDDLCAMSLCDYIVAVPSTFSRWASFIGRAPIAVIERGKTELDLANLEPAPW